VSSSVVAPERVATVSIGLGLLCAAVSAPGGISTLTVRTIIESNAAQPALPTDETVSGAETGLKAGEKKAKKPV